MKTILSVLTAGLILTSLVDLRAAEGPAKQSGPAFAQSGSAPQLGPAAADIEIPPAPGLTPEKPVPKTNSAQRNSTQNVPPAPAPENSPNDSAPANVPPANDARQNEAGAAIVQAQELLNQRRYEDAVRVASRAIALDPAGVPDFKRIRATAYLSLGRFEEALADSSPLEVTVSSPRAELKTKQTVLGIVTAGTTVMIDDVNGNWLKVASVGDTKYDWAWIRQRDVQTAERPAQPQKIEYNIPSYAPMPIDTVPRGPVIYYGPGPYYNSNYGRAYYDYWRHVPQQYWQFLPY